MIEGLKPYPKYKPAGLPWLDAVPRHWDLAPNRALMRDRRDRVGEEVSDYTLLSLTLRGVIARDMENPKGKFPAQFNTYKIVRPNDFVFCLFDIDETPRGVGLSGQRGMITGAYDVFSPTPRIHPRFHYHYYLFVDEGKLMKPFYTGLRKTIQRGTFASLKAPLPPPDEQAAIVRFLDHANRKIDGFIRAKRKLIALLNEQKQAIIHRAVTRGLDPNAKLKPSGIPWLGEIPEHWEVRRAKYLFREIDDRSKEGKETHLAMSQRLGLVPSNLVGSAMRSESYAGGKLCEDGDLVLNRLKAHLGVFALANQAGVISPDYSVFRKRAAISMEYYESVLKSSACRRELRIRAKGLVEGFWRLYTDDFYDIRLPVPPLDEQREIMSAVSAETASLNTAIARTEREIALMQEYRTRLTADIVTGKLDVREAAAKLPEVAYTTNGSDDTEDTDDEITE
jgi:type I restriction enzyme S subunit